MDTQFEAEYPPGLQALKDCDALLRCPICFDFLNISMMTKCSHNFCSLCIRKFFAYKLQCPVCNTQATEADLRNNRILDDLVASFQAVRKQLSKANFESPPISPKTPASAVKCKTPRVKGEKCSSSVLSHFFQKRPKTTPTKETKRDTSVSHCIQPRKMETAVTYNANDADLHSTTAQLPVSVKEEPMDVDLASVPGLTSVKQEDMASHSINSGAEMELSSTQSKAVKPVIKVECPVCSVGVPEQFINKHLDTCLTRGEKKESLRSSNEKGKRPMGKVVYNLLSLQELKRRLKECHLSVQGSRDQLIKRHREFVHIYNAQCDALNPKSGKEIAKELEANEKIRNRLKEKSKPVMVFSKNQSEKEIEEMHSSYRKQHSGDFSRLVAEVRGRLETSRQTRIKQEAIVNGEDAQKTNSADQAGESKSCLVVKVDEEEADKDPSVIKIELPSSPTYSDVSISSSISDIFGPEPETNPEHTETTSVQKRTSRSRGDDAASLPVFGKRRRKT